MTSKNRELDVKYFFTFSEISKDTVLDTKYSCKKDNFEV